MSTMQPVSPEFMLCLLCNLSPQRSFNVYYATCLPIFYVMSAIYIIQPVSPEFMYCLVHALKTCPEKKLTLKFRYTLQELQEIPAAVNERLPAFRKWTKKVRDKKDCKPCEYFEKLSAPDSSQFPSFGNLGHSDLRSHLIHKELVFRYIEMCR